MLYRKLLQPCYLDATDAERSFLVSFAVVEIVRKLRANLTQGRNAAFRLQAGWNLAASQPFASSSRFATSCSLKAAFLSAAASPLCVRRASAVFVELAFGCAFAALRKMRAKSSPPLLTGSSRTCLADGERSRLDTCAPGYLTGSSRIWLWPARLIWTRPLTVSILISGPPVPICASKLWPMGKGLLTGRLKSL